MNLLTPPMEPRPTTAGMCPGPLGSDSRWLRWVFLSSGRSSQGPFGLPSGARRTIVLFSLWDVFPWSLAF